MLKVIWHACIVTHLIETVRYMEVTRAQLPMGMQKRKMGSKTCQWSPSSRLWVLYSTVQYITVQYSASAPPPSDSGSFQPDLSPMLVRQRLFNIHVHTQKPDLWLP